jgi:hypothetical protein
MAMMVVKVEVEALPENREIMMNLCCMIGGDLISSCILCYYCLLLYFTMYFVTSNEMLQNMNIPLCEQGGHQSLALHMLACKRPLHQ